MSNTGVTYISNSKLEELATLYPQFSKEGIYRYFRSMSGSGLSANVVTQFLYILGSPDVDRIVSVSPKPFKWVIDTRSIRKAMFNARNAAYELIDEGRPKALTLMGIFNSREYDNLTVAEVRQLLSQNKEEINLYNSLNDKDYSAKWTFISYLKVEFCRNFEVTGDVSVLGKIFDIIVPTMEATPKEYYRVIIVLKTFINAVGVLIK